MVIRIEHNYKKLIGQYLTPKHTLWIDLLLLGLSTIVVLNRVGWRNKFTVRSMKENPIFVQWGEKVPLCDKLRNSTLIEHGLYLYIANSVDSDEIQL